MDWELLLKFVEALKWPTILVVFIWAFHSEDRALLKRLSEFELPGGIKGKFKDDIKKGEEQADNASLPTDVIPQSTPHSTTTTTTPPLDASVIVEINEIS